VDSWNDFFITVPHLSVISLRSHSLLSISSVAVLLSSNTGSLFFQPLQLCIHRIPCTRQLCFLLSTSLFFSQSWLVWPSRSSHFQVFRQWVRSLRRRNSGVFWRCLLSESRQVSSSLLCPSAINFKTSRSSARGAVVCTLPVSMMSVLRWYYCCTGPST
jgi:hypothetical protein